MACHPSPPSLRSGAMGGMRRLGPLTLAGLVVTFAVVPVTTAAHANTLATFQAQGSVEQVYVTNAPSGDVLTLEDAAHVVVSVGRVDDLGSLVFRKVMPGDGYTVVDGDQSTLPLLVMAANEPPPQSFYDTQHLVDGFQYITTRDGTRLSAA